MNYNSDEVFSLQILIKYLFCAIINILEHNKQPGLIVLIKLKVEVMIMPGSKTRATLIILAVSLLIGAAAGFALSDGARAVSGVSVPDTLSFESVKDFVLPLCIGTVLEACAIFISGFMIRPEIVQIPLFGVRGFAIGYTAHLFSGADADTLIGLVTYLFITLLLLALALAGKEYSRKADKFDARRLAAFSYSFMMICGCSIIVRSAPYFIKYLIEK